MWWTKKITITHDFGSAFACSQTIIWDNPRLASKASFPGWFHDVVGAWPSTPLKNDGVKVKWDDDIPQKNGKIIQMFQTTNQLL